MTLLSSIRTIREVGFTPSIRAQFSDEELYVIQKILEEYEERGRSDTLEALFKNDFERKPVSIDEFVENDYYLGKIGRDVYPAWRKDLREVLSPLTSVGEWVLKGSIGCGKTFTAVIAVIYKMYYLLCLKDPQKFHGLASGSPIVFGLFNIYKYLAAATSFTYLTTWLRDMSPFFAEQRGDHLDQKRLSDKAVLNLPKNLSIALGAASIHSLGQNIYGGLMDETEFGKAKSVTSTEKSQVADLYNSVRMRMISRFLKRGGTNPGLLCLVSSARDTEQFLSKHVQKKVDDPHTYVSSYALYDVKVEYQDAPRFQVVVGDRIHSSYIVDEEHPIREGARVIEVPKEFLPVFEFSLDDAIRDIAGTETFGSSLLIPQRDKFRATLDSSTSRKHPFTQEEVSLSIDDDVTIEDYFLHDEILELWDKTHTLYKPKFYPNADRYVHVDLAKNGDCAGLAMSCVSRTVYVDRVTKGGLRLRARDYIHFVDLMLRIRAMHGSQIDFAKIRQFIFFLQGTCNFRIRWVGYDSYQSTDSIQTFKKEHLQSKEVSLDRKPGPYQTFKRVALEGRLDWYWYEPFYDEVVALVDHTRSGVKVKGPAIDHPPGGSKDVADGVCGSITGSLLCKGEQITGTDAEVILERSQQYLNATKEAPPIKSAKWLTPELKNSNPLDSLFDDGEGT